MKTLFLVRHAKSSWKEVNLSDYRRPLNKRGRKDAPYMGRLLKGMGVSPEIVVSSPAVRAAETAKIICGELGINEKEIHYEEDIYEASAEEILRVLRQTKDSINSVMLFGHNPGLTYLSNYLSGKEIINIPTAGVVGLLFDGSKWSALGEHSCRFNFFEYPKKFSSKE